jgi:hypothetical protein
MLTVAATPAASIGSAPCGSDDERLGSVLKGLQLSASLWHSLYAGWVPPHSGYLHTRSAVSVGALSLYPKRIRLGLLRHSLYVGQGYSHARTAPKPCPAAPSLPPRESA